MKLEWLDEDLSLSLERNPQTWNPTK